MKKLTVMKSFLILLPVLAVGMATTVNSVTVFDTVSGTTEYYSYFDLVPVKNLQMLPPLAAILSLISGIFAAVWLGKKKENMLKYAGFAAFAAAMAACIPVIIRGDVLVVPNVALPLFMLAQYVVARQLGKMPAETKQQKKGPRLKHR